MNHLKFQFVHSRLADLVTDNSVGQRKDNNLSAIKIEERILIGVNTSLIIFLIDKVNRIESKTYNLANGGSWTGKIS